MLSNLGCLNRFCKVVLNDLVFIGWCWFWKNDGWFCCYGGCGWCWMLGGVDGFNGNFSVLVYRDN